MRPWIPVAAVSVLVALVALRAGVTPSTPTADRAPASPSPVTSEWSVDDEPTLTATRPSDIEPAPTRPSIEPERTPERVLAGSTVRPWGSVRHILGEQIADDDAVGQALYADVSAMHTATFEMYRTSGRPGAEDIDAAAFHARSAALAERVRRSPYANAEVFSLLGEIDGSLVAYADAR